jgi:hypothetical protein
MNEHNPIAQLVNNIQKQWLAKTANKPSLRFVRFIIKPEEARVYEGFCKLESSEHGSLPEVFVTQLTSFEDEDTFSAALIKDWLDTYDKSTGLLEQLQQKAGFSWDARPFRQALERNNGTSMDDILLSLLASFRQALPQRDKQLVLALIPRQVSSTKHMRDWVSNLLKKGIPAGVKLLVIDHVNEEHFALHDRQFPDMLLSLHIPLDLQGAIQKLATSGNPNDPEITLRKCTFEMGAAMKDKDVKRLHRWGQQALDATQRSGNKGLFATAHIMYAGMLFHFKKDPRIPELLERGQRIAKQGTQQGDGACLPLLVQFYGYHGAYAQIRRRFTEAINWFIQQAEVAEQHKFQQQALNAWYQAAELCRRKDSSRYYDVLEKGYKAGWHLPDEEISASIYIYLLRDYYDYVHANRKYDIVQAIDEKMGRLFGNDWKADVDTIRKNRAPMILPLEMEQTETLQP